MMARGGKKHTLVFCFTYLYLFSRKKLKLMRFLSVQNKLGVPKFMYYVVISGWNTILRSDGVAHESGVASEAPL